MVKNMRDSQSDAPVIGKNGLSGVLLEALPTRITPQDSVQIRLASGQVVAVPVNSIVVGSDGTLLIPRPYLRRTRINVTITTTLPLSTLNSLFSSLLVINSIFNAFNTSLSPRLIYQFTNPTPRCLICIGGLSYKVDLKREYY